MTRYYVSDNCLDTAPEQNEVTGEVYPYYEVVLASEYDALRAEVERLTRERDEAVKRNNEDSGILALSGNQVAWLAGKLADIERKYLAIQREQKAQDIQLDAVRYRAEQAEQELAASQARVRELEGRRAEWRISKKELQDPEYMAAYVEDFGMQVDLFVQAQKELRTSLEQVEQERDRLRTALEQAEADNRKAREIIQAGFLTDTITPDDLEWAQQALRGAGEAHHDSL